MNGRAWTEAELEFIHDNIGFLSYRELSRELKRSPSAIESCRRRHGLPSYYDNVISTGILAIELGKSRGAVRKWVNHGWIKCKRAEWRARFGNKPLLYKEQDIVSFLKEHFKLFNYRLIPNRYFRNIVEECYSQLYQEEECVLSQPTPQTISQPMSLQALSSA